MIFWELEILTKILTAMIVLAVTIAVGALIGICAICLCYTRHRMERHSKHEYPNINQIPKFGTIFLPNPPAGSSHDMLYETQASYLIKEILHELDNNKI